jgi:hypothetical protein
MPAPKNINKTTRRKKEDKPLWKNLLLALTLVPLVAGLILLAAWVLDFKLVSDLESQVWIGVLFILLSFTLSNLIQERWRLFAAWLLLLVADGILLAWVNFTAQIIAIILAVIGVILLGIEIYRHFEQQAQQGS